MESSRNTIGRRFSLRAKLLCAILALSAIVLVFLLGYFGPRTAETFIDRSGAMIESSANALRDLSLRHSADAREILVQLIRHSTEARVRTLKDLPLGLYGGAPDRILGAIREQDQARADRLLGNVRVLGVELERRAKRDIEQHVERLATEQADAVTALAADQRRSYLLLSGGLVAVLLVLLGVGLDRAIVRPVQRLRDATQRVAAGDLTVGIEGEIEAQGLRSTDELGDLGNDFGAMVRQLRASRDEIREKNERLHGWNRALGEEVGRKTHHLEKALQHLKATQQRLVQADKMASIGTLAGGIAHEFNNLIGGIRGCVRSALTEETSPDDREPLEVALRATERAEDITRKLLRFASPRIGAIATASIREPILEVLDLVEPQARRQGVTVTTEYENGLPVLVDVGEMHQVFLNLITNALQAMPDGGQLSIRERRKDGNVIVEVRDTGGGIPDSRIGHVFDPFYTSKHGEAGEERTGTGLGLSVSYGIVKAHGGDLDVVSEVGRGSTFRVTLPEVGEGESQ